MEARPWFVIALAGCSFQVPAAGDDGSGDVRPLDAPATCSAWQPHLFVPCAIPAPSGDLHLTTTGSPYTYDTSSGGGTLRDSGGAAIAVATTTIDQPDPDGAVTTALISVTSFTLDPNAQLWVIGGKPLIVASWSTIDVGGTIDAGSHVGGRVGAGKGPPACAAHGPGVGEAGNATGGSGGGGGGAFRGAGGHGGDGDSNHVTGDHNKVGATGGTAVGVPTILRGGCSGGDSGIAGSYVPTNPNQVGARGEGGGAIHLSAQTSIQITGAVLAGGAGGGGAPTATATGGGGGGAGGFVGLEAPTIALMGVLAANGGGGGESGSSSTAGVAGADGQASAVPAAGAMGASCGPAGGAGGAGATIDGVTSLGVDSCGGGGGGGGAGYVMVWSPDFVTAGSTVSPAATRNP
jgi:hypothetical protein